MKRCIVLAAAAALLLSACGSSATNPAPSSSSASAAPPASPARSRSTMQAPDQDQPDQTVPPLSASQMVHDKLAQILAGDWRTPAEKARDRYRHPIRTLQFFGVRPDMTVIEIEPAGGWYAAILAPFLKDNGTYIGAMVAPDSGKEAARDAAALKARFAAHPRPFGKARLIEFDPRNPTFGAPGSADRVLTFRNAHNWTDAGTAPAMFKAFYTVLKPGGVLGVVDHRADADATPAEVRHSGYLPQAYMIKLAEDAGFKLDGKSGINANPKDDHHHPKGVWTLPPTLARGDKDKAKYMAIGESDRMTLRFLKPAAARSASAAAAGTAASQ